ncbi:hypothetical protein [Streptomyces sp. HGB0020]|uniref:hypothetical protein n=1 Tax=Streptomyces sp. HGB0020 TaxID=1078086 RepID=UPI00034EC2D2|nr:hypothetical protein [Streptomyces sp. HGB0020]EPD63159.1 hypothetical protein HMPREF1211_03500 [Streptomyces sp. HGB0020]
MAKQFRHIRPRNLTIASHTGARIDHDTRCEHGQAAVFLAIFGKRVPKGSPEQRFDALVSRCVLAELIGAVQAQIAHEEGKTALDDFLQEVNSHTLASHAALEQLSRQKRDCCEAGFTTDGREHTCGRNEAGQ